MFPHTLAHLDLFLRSFLLICPYLDSQEEIAALNLAKFTKTQQELEEAYERSEVAEMALAKMRGGKGVRGPSVF